MGAYNWVLSQQRCPACRQLSTIKSQLHIAASFDGDENGRFSNREYHLGDTLNWFTGTRLEKAYDNSYKITPDPPGVATECCYSTCNSCNFEGFVIVTLQQLKLSSITAVEALEDWPEDYYR